jgi:hydrogenase maturation protease
VTRVIGLGSPFGDDRAGWLVVERLRTRVPAGIDCIALDRPGAALAAYLVGCARVILVDAALTGAPAGTLLTARAEDIDNTGGRVSSHGGDLHTALALAAAISERPPQVELVLVSIGGLDTLSAPVEAACRTLVKQLARQLRTPLPKHEILSTSVAGRPTPTLAGKTRTLPPRASKIPSG